MSVCCLTISSARASRSLAGAATSSTAVPMVASLIRIPLLASPTLPRQSFDVSTPGSDRATRRGPLRTRREDATPRGGLQGVPPAGEAVPPAGVEPAPAEPEVIGNFVGAIGTGNS